MRMTLCCCQYRWSPSAPYCRLRLFAYDLGLRNHRHLVPLIFEAYAKDIARRVGALDPVSVLETAAGSGVVSRPLAPELSSDARYVVTDLNQPMLDRAASEQGPEARISWRRADALTSPASRA